MTICSGFHFILKIGSDSLLLFRAALFFARAVFHFGSGKNGLPGRKYVKYKT